MSNHNQPVVPRKRRLEIDDYVQGVLRGDRAILAQTITLVESNAPKHLDMAQEVLKRLLPYTGNSIRVGITGVPGAGKSTLIEALGSMLCDQGHRLAVLAIDPSSSLTGGSILGDKTRMEKLAHHPRAFIRPSPSGGTLGGVTRKSRETILVCEAAGFDLIIVETVGVGQNEVTVRSMVDFFLLVVLTGAGDELQGMKKGVMELADAIFVNKADGDNEQFAQQTKAEYNQILHYLQPATAGWQTKAYTCSARTGRGLEEMWKVIQSYKEVTSASGIFEANRQKQALDWMKSMIHEQLTARFYQHPQVLELLPSLEAEVTAGNISPTLAVQQLLQAFDKR